MTVREIDRTGGDHQYTAVLDLRLHDPRERLPLLEMTLATLKPGEDMLVIAGSKPERLQQYLDERYNPEFSRTDVQAGPELWQMCLRRTRPQAPSA